MQILKDAARKKNRNLTFFILRKRLFGFAEAIFALPEITIIICIGLKKRGIRT